MKLTAFLSVLLLAGGAAAERLTVAPDRPEALYRSGEQAVFTLKLTSEEGKPVTDREVRYYLYGDDFIKGKGTLRTGRDGTAEVKTGLRRPARERRRWKVRAEPVSIHGKSRPPGPNRPTSTLTGRRRSRRWTRSRCG